MSKPFVVAVNCVSGGGKTALAGLVHASLAESVLRGLRCEVQVFAEVMSHFSPPASTGHV